MLARLDAFIAGSVGMALSFALVVSGRGWWSLMPMIVALGYALLPKEDN